MDRGKIIKFFILFSGEGYSDLANESIELIIDRFKQLLKTDIKSENNIEFINVAIANIAYVFYMINKNSSTIDMKLMANLALISYADYIAYFLNELENKKIKIKEVNDEAITFE